MSSLTLPATLCNAALVCYLMLFPCHSEFMDGSVNLMDDNGFSFLGHWMFSYNTGNGTKDSWHANDYAAGRLEITLKLHSALIKDALFELALYDDQESSRGKLFANKSNACLSTATYNGINTDISRENHKIHFLEDKDGNDTWSGTIHIHEHLMARWWWVYLVKCDIDSTVAGDFINNDIKYKLHWTQLVSSPWQAELSLHEEFQNTFHCVIPWLILTLFLLQCGSIYLYQTSITRNYIHPILKALTTCLALEFVASLFELIFWVHYSNTGYKEFQIMTFALLFYTVSSAIFFYILVCLFSLGVRMSISHLSSRVNSALVIGCVLIGVFEFIVLVWSYQYYPDEEDILYRYTEYPMHLFGTSRWLLGVGFYVVLLVQSVRDSWGGIVTVVQRNYRVLAGFVLFFAWFLWPIIAVGAVTTFEKSRMDFGCDVVSWTMRMLSFVIVVGIVHPWNPYHDRWYDFGKQFVHARYVKNGAEVIFGDSEEDDSDEEKDDGGQVQMNEIKKSTVFSTKFGKKKKGKDAKGGLKQKLFKYNGRDQIGQFSDSDEDTDELIEDEERERDVVEKEEEVDRDAGGVAGAHVSVQALSIKDLVNEENQTLKAEDSD